MARSDIHLDAMLRHLGAAYYESLHSRATRADVTRAVDIVEEHLHGQAQRHLFADVNAAVRNGSGIKSIRQEGVEYDFRRPDT